MWKRDLRKAFRGMPIYHGHRRLAYVVWAHRGQKLVARHVGMPFGTESAVVAFHRFGALISFCVRHGARAPACRYVDDYFGGSRVGVQITGGVLVTELARLMGRPTDEAKSEDAQTKMVVLGAEVSLQHEQWRVLARVDAQKAAHWKGPLLDALATGRMDPGTSSKVAGRLSFAVTVAADRCGRAFIRPFHAQAHDPMQANRTSVLMKHACVWFLHYLEERPCLVREPGGRRQSAVLWTDAAGDPPALGAVLFVDNKFFFWQTAAPAWLLKQFIRRSDSYIGLLEQMAVNAAVATFSGQLQGRRVFSFVDNNGVLYAILRGSSKSPEANLMQGALWLCLAKLRVAAHFFRVESVANVADGPSRGDLRWLHSLGAVEVPVQWPEWATDVWSSPLTSLPPGARR